MYAQLVSNQHNLENFKAQLEELQEPMKQSVINLMHYLLDYHLIDNKTVAVNISSIFLPTSSDSFMGQWSGYENAVLFPKKMFPNVVHALGTLTQNNFVGAQVSVSVILGAWQIVLVDKPVKPAIIDLSMRAVIESNEPLAKDVLRILDWLDENKLKMADQKFDDLDTVYRIARQALQGVRKYSIPENFNWSALGNEQHVVRCVNAIRFFYDVCNMFGSFNYHVDNIEIERRRAKSENIVIQIFREVASIPKEERRGVFVLNGDFSFLNGSQGPKSEIFKQRVPHGHVAAYNLPNGLLDVPEVKPFKLVEYIDSLSPAERFQLFQFAYRLSDFTLSEFRVIAQRSYDLGVGICNYMFHLTDNTIMRRVINGVVSNIHPTILNPNDPHANIYYWLADIFQLTEKYYSTTDVFTNDTDNSDNKDEVVANKVNEPVTPERFLNDLKQASEKAVDTLLGEINGKLNDNEYLEGRVTHDLQRKIVTVKIDVKPVATTVLGAVLERLEQQGWETSVNNSDHENMFVIRLEAKSN